METIKNLILVIGLGILIGKISDWGIILLEKSDRLDFKRFFKSTLIHLSRKKNRKTKTKG